MKRWLYLSILLPFVCGAQDGGDADSATRLEFRLVDAEINALEISDSDELPVGREILNRRDGTPVVLYQERVISNQHIDQVTISDQVPPAVEVHFGPEGAQRMLEATRENLNRPIAVVLISGRSGETESIVINVATIRGSISDSLQITGLTVPETVELASAMSDGLSL
ncbi:MAG: SecDF P1 head subdomain-containing protein [Gammaproteobacteria bacterium]